MRDDNSVDALQHGVEPSLEQVSHAALAQCRLDCCLALLLTRAYEKHRVVVSPECGVENVAPQETHGSDNAVGRRLGEDSDLNAHDGGQERQRVRTPEQAREGCSTPPHVHAQ